MSNAETTEKKRNEREFGAIFIKILLRDDDDDVTYKMDHIGAESIMKCTLLFAVLECMQNKRSHFHVHFNKDE